MLLLFVPFCAVNLLGWTKNEFVSCKFDAYVSFYPITHANGSDFGNVSSILQMISHTDNALHG